MSEPAKLNLTNEEDWELTLEQIALIKQDPQSCSADTLRFLELHSQSLRSKISLEALQCFAVVLLARSDGSVPQEDRSRLALMLLVKATSSDKKFIAQAAHQCLDALLQLTGEEYKEYSWCQVLLEIAVEHKNNAKLVLEAMVRAKKAGGGGGTVAVVELALQVEHACKSAPARQLAVDIVLASSLPADTAHAALYQRVADLRARRTTSQNTNNNNKPWKA